MLKKLLYPLKINIFILLISIFSLIPFSFLIIAENITIGTASKPFKNVNDNCLFELSGYAVETIDDIESFAQESINEIKKLGKNDYVKTDYVVSDSVYVKDSDGVYSTANLYYSNDFKTLEQYMTLEFQFNYRMDTNSDSFFAASKNIQIFVDDELVLYSRENREISEKFIITSEFDSNQEGQTILCANAQMNERLLGVLSNPVIDFVHYFKTPVNSSFTNKAALATTKEFNSKSYTLTFRTQGYDIVFGEGKLIVSIVSVLISIVLFYAFARKESMLYKIEETKRHFYQSKVKNVAYHVGSDLLVAAISYIVCLFIILLATIILNANGLSFIFDHLILVLFLTHFIIVSIESFASYIYFHCFRKRL